MDVIPTISEDQIMTWRTDGVVALRGVMSEDWLNLLREGVDATLADPSGVSKDYAEPDKYDVELFEVEPGDAVAFHGKSLHSATPNSSKDIRRRALSLRFGGDDITWNPRPYIPSVPDRPDLIAGGPVDSEQYPRIWTA